MLNRRGRVSTGSGPSIAAMLIVAYVAFLAIGLPEGVLGTVWPDVRDTVDRATEDLGVVLIAYTGGYLLTTMVSGHLAERIGLGRTLVSAASVALFGALLFAATGRWIGVLAGAVFLAMGSGLTDSSLNSYLALHHNARAMNVAHALFGVGATLGPLLVEVTLRAGAGWEVVYVAIAVLNGGLAVAYLAHRGVVDTTPAEILGEATTPRRATALVISLLAVFFFYVATEASVGAWSFSLLTEERAVSDTVGRIMVATFWGGLTAGRFALGWLGHRFPLRWLLRWSVGGVAAGVALLWIDPFPGADLAALPLVGVAMAGIFPALVLLTPGWLGSGRTGRIVGYQLAASNLGAVIAAELTRRLVASRGEGAIATAFVIAAVGLVAAFVILDRLAPRSRAGALEAK